MTDREKAIRYFQQTIDSAPVVRLSAIKEHVDACEAALAALRAEEEREKGCEYCKNRFGIATHHVTESGMQAGTNKAAAFCPMCGRKLDGGGQDARKGEAGER